jgi:hypothetical protein
MEHKKDIGKAIREKLDALDKAPGDHLWAAIEADLPKKKKRRLLPFWITFISVSVIGLLLWSLLGNPENYWSRPDNTERATDNGNSNPQDDIMNSGSADENAGEKNGSNSSSGNVTEASTENKSHNGSRVGNGATSGNSANDGGRNPDDTKKSNGSAKAGKSANQINYKQGQKLSAKTKWRKTKKAKHKTDGTSGTTLAGTISNDNTAGEKNASEAGNSGSLNTGSDGASRTDTSGIAADKTQKEAAKNDSIAKALVAEKKKLKEKPKDSLAKQELEQESFKTFRIFLYAAPTYYNTFSKISSIDKDLDSLPRKAEITYNYGGYLCFDYDEKWSFRFGVAKTKLRHRTEGIAVSSLDNQNYYNIDYGNISNVELQERFADSERFDLIQDISYIEFPIEIKYKLAGDKLGVEGIGGISTGLLKGNTITAESDNNGSVVIGSTKDQYKAYFSVNVGAGFYWRFADNFRLNVEPIFKYHFRTASTALQPYSVVVLGGLEYTFNWRTKKKADKK